jgi:hypothetical protein
MMPVSERIDWSASPVPRRVAVATTVVQVHLVSSYLLGGVLPYFWREATYANLADGPVPDWVLVVPGLLFFLPAFWMVAFDAVMGLLLTMMGLSVLAACGRWLTVRTRNWLLAAVMLSVGLVAFSFTPIADAIRTWVLD